LSARRIITYGHSVLKRRAEEVVQLDADIAALIDDMFATMYGARGVGLAANQVGRLIRVAVVHPRGEGDQGQPLALINPEILEYAGSEVFEEGCLSVPGIFADLRRPERILVRFLDKDGHEETREFSGMPARVIQHEIDHLEGRLFVDHLSAMRKALLMKKLKAIAEDSAEDDPASS